MTVTLCQALLSPICAFAFDASVWFFNVIERKQKDESVGKGRVAVMAAISGTLILNFRRSYTRAMFEVLIGRCLRYWLSLLIPFYGIMLLYHLVKHPALLFPQIYRFSIAQIFLTNTNSDFFKELKSLLFTTRKVCPFSQIQCRLYFDEVVLTAHKIWDLVGFSFFAIVIV